MVEIAAVEDHGFFVMSIRDNGIGIEADYLDRIFEIFQRVQTPSRYSGTGIGLAIVRKGVELHHGTLWVESAPDAGSTFFLRLPARQPAAQSQKNTD